MSPVQKQQLIRHGNLYKERVYAALFEALMQRFAAVDWEALNDYSQEEILQMLYMQGVADALEALDLEALVRAVETAESALKA